MGQARFEGNQEKRNQSLGLARVSFQESAKLLAQASVAIEKQFEAMKKSTEPSAQQTIATLGQARLRAELELGLNLLDQAQSYADAPIRPSGPIC